MSEKEYLPKPYLEFKERYPEVAEAYEALGKACHDGGPLEPRVRELVKIGLSAAVGSEGALKSHVRQALDAGAGPEEIRHAVMLALTTTGFPKTIAALGWVDEVLTARSGNFGG
jgi:4-carboxymuconolactone decarboxylase